MAPKNLDFSALRQALSAPAHLSYSGEVQTMEVGQASSQVAVYRVEHRAPDLTRRWYLAPRSLYGDTVIVRGKLRYAVDVHRNRIVFTKRSNDSDVTPDADDLALMAKNYRLVSAPQQRLVGRLANVLLLVNRFTDQTAMRVFVDTQTHLVLESERYGPDGSLISSTRFEMLRYEHSVPKALFTVPRGMPQVDGPNYGPPSPNIARVAGHAGFTARSPRYLPDGFEPITAGIASIDGIRTLDVLYSDGIRTVSLYENARNAAVDLRRLNPRSIRVGSHLGLYAERGSTTLLSWRKGPLHLALVGALPIDELARIAASI
ncbi:MAG: sigma-E factor regulatory protein RseB domain-containing protein [Vulcanimicrobiaceae bacterium]